MMPSDDLASNMHDFAGVSVHTWAQNTHPSGVTAAPRESWLDAIPGPVLDGVFLSTQALVVLLVGLIGVAIVMAARAAGAASTPDSTLVHPVSHDRRSMRAPHGSHRSHAEGR